MTIENPNSYLLGELLDGGIKPSLSAKALLRGSRQEIVRFLEYEPYAVLTDVSTPSVQPDVIQATRTIMQSSQKGFLGTWLPDCLKGIRNIVVTQKDKERNPGVDFGECVRIIEEYKDNLLTIEPAPLAKIKELLGKIRPITSDNRITHAVVGEETNGIGKVLVLGSAISIAEMLWQKKTGLNPFVYAMASSFDNLTAIGAEVKVLIEKGYTLKEALKAMKVPALVLASSWSLAPVIDGLFENGNNTLAGAIYGVESGICTAPQLGTALSMREGYESLVIEGKADNPRLLKFLNKGEKNLIDKTEIYWLGLAQSLKHNLVYPHRAGLALGAATSLVISTMAASVQTGEARNLLQNPFVVGWLGIGDSVGGSLAAVFKDQIFNIKLARDLRKLVG